MLTCCYGLPLFVCMLNLLNVVAIRHTCTRPHVNARTHYVISSSVQLIRSTICWNNDQLYTYNIVQMKNKRQKYFTYRSTMQIRQRRTARLQRSPSVHIRIGHCLESNCTVSYMTAEFSSKHTHIHCRTSKGADQFVSRVRMCEAIKQVGHTPSNSVLRCV